MNEKPIYINFMGLTLVSIALFFPIQIMYLYKLSFLDIGNIVNKLTFFNFVSMILLAVTAYYAFKIEPKLYYTLPLLNIFIFFNNYIVAEYGDIYTHTETLIPALIFSSITLGFYQQNIYKVFHETNFRYWLTSKRHLNTMPILIKYKDKEIWAETYDISQTGMFITDTNFGKLYKMTQNSIISMTLFTDKNKSIDLEGKIVRKSMAKGTYPQGIGIHFSEILNKDFDQRIAA